MKTTFTLIFLLQFSVFAQSPTAQTEPKAPAADTSVLFKTPGQTPTTNTLATPTPTVADSAPKSPSAPKLSLSTIPTTNALLALPTVLMEQPNASLAGASFGELTMNLRHLDQPEQSGLVADALDTGETPSTALVSPSTKLPQRENSFWTTSGDQMSLVEVFQDMIKGPRPQPIAATWTDRSERYPRPDHLVREPGLKIFSLRF
jgi:hypothetical protein